MIKVVITGPPKNGYFPYRVDWFAAGQPQLVGLSPAPLLDACRQLQQMGLMDSTVVGLYDQEDDDFYSFRTTVGAGAKRLRGLHVEQVRQELGAEPGNAMELAAEVIDALQATPEEEQPEPHTPPKRQAGKGRAHAEPDKPEPPHRKRKRAGSGARRGSR